MKQRMYMAAWTLGFMVLVPGCKSLFSSNQSTTLSRWKNYDDVESAFEKILPRHTTVADLQTLGFDPQVSPNVKILTYVDIIQAFIPNPGIRLHDLPEGVRECIGAKEASRAYLVELQDIRDKRHGSLFLDVFGFQRQTHESGWRFKGLILIKDNVVVYKLSSGEPQVAREDSKVKPLGPFQELDGSIVGVLNFTK